jgi:hypothetical protein
MSQQDLGAGAASGATLHPLRAIPGGASAIPEEWVAAGILLGALGGLLLIRKNLGTEGRTIASGTAAVTFLLYYLIATALVRLVASNLAHRSDSGLSRGIAFFA